MSQQTSLLLIRPRTWPSNQLLQQFPQLIHISLKPLAMIVDELIAIVEILCNFLYYTKRPCNYVQHNILYNYTSILSFCNHVPWASSKRHLFVLCVAVSMAKGDGNEISPKINCSVLFISSLIVFQSSPQFYDTQGNCGRKLTWRWLKSETVVCFCFMELQLDFRDVVIK